MSTLNKHAVQAIIFDHDGTLVDSEPVHLQCWQQVVAPYSVELDLSTYRRHLSGTPSAHSAKWFIETYKLNARAEHLLELKIEQLNRYLEQRAFPLREGAYDAVVQLSQRYPLAIASGAKNHEVMRSVSAHQMTHLFQYVCTQDDVEQNKPAPDVYLLAAQRLGIKPEACLAIEDSDPGQQAALAAGIPCLRIDAGDLPSPPGVTRITHLNQIATLL